MCTTTGYARHLALAERACAYLTASTDPFHAVSNAVARLEAAGFVRLRTGVPFFDGAEDDGGAKIAPGGKYYYTVHHGALVAFRVGRDYVPGRGGFHIIGGHTDSPNLRVKPRSKKPTKNGCLQLGVECYGGGLWHTWFDRDLGISGKVLVRDNDEDGAGKIRHRLVKLGDPVARISTLAIHLQSGEERKAFAVNKEDHTSPIVGMAPNDKDKDRGSGEEEKKELEDGAERQLNDWQKNHEPVLLRRIADQLDIGVEQIADLELGLFDTQAAAIGGMQREFLYSGRLDNLATVFCAVEALVHHAKAAAGEGEDDAEEEEAAATATATATTDSDVRMMVAFDHEEIGSCSTQGAGSVVMQEAVRRVSSALQAGKDTPDLYGATIDRSFILSIDMAHAVHPNYAGKHESQHGPVLNGGVVIKSNSNQRYATNSETGFLVRELARTVGAPIQEFVVRNDCPCGSTIGPILSAKTGIRVADAGMPQLSMHSCREVMGVADLTHGLDLFKAFYGRFREVDDSLVSDE